MADTILKQASLCLPSEVLEDIYLKTITLQKNDMAMIWYNLFLSSKLYDDDLYVVIDGEIIRSMKRKDSVDIQMRRLTLFFSNIGVVGDSEDTPIEIE